MLREYCKNHLSVPLLLLGSLPALAAVPDAPQENVPGVTVTDSGNRVIYGPEYFEPFNVITASDQLERIPGIQDLLNGGGGGRGFGNSGDQVLINGKRLSGKSNDIGSTLGRIQARQVLRIEVIRGTVEGLDVRSQGRVVNVVLEDALRTGYGSWEGSLEHYSDGRSAPGVEVNYAGDAGALNFLASLEAGHRLDSEEQSDLFYTPGGALFERQAEESRGETDEYSFTANTTYSLDNGDTFHLNGLYSREEQSNDQFSDRFLVLPPGEDFVREVLIANADSSRNWEIGGDYEHILANGKVWTGLFVLSSRGNEDESTLSTAPDGGAALREEVQKEEGTDTESILRSTYRWGITETRSIESGAELAINTVERDIRLFEDENGTLSEVQLFNQNSKVEEQRLEAFTTYTWNARSDLLLEGSLDAEYSRLSQEGGDVSRERNFFFLRPRLVARYDLSPSTQLRARIERRVEQLDFGAFSASFSNDDNRRDVISAGNPELVPEKSWRYELTWEKRLPADLGLVSVTGSYNDIEDQQGRIPLLVLDENGELEERTAPGNIGDARSMRLEFNGSLRLDWLGLDGALLEGSLEVGESEVTDPFTGEPRDINWSSPWEWSLSFRQDTDWKNFSYGVSTWQQAENQQFDLDFRQRGRDDPDLEIFAEMQPMQNLTLRLEIEQALRAESERERFQFIGNRGDGVLERREVRVSRPAREITFSIEGTF